MGLSDLRVIVSSPLPLRSAPAAEPQPATVATSDGQFISGATAEVSMVGSAWSATLRQFSRPGAMASAYFSDGLRAVIVRLADGRCARGRIAGTSFLGGGERIYQVDGIGPLPEFP